MNTNRVSSSRNEFQPKTDMNQALECKSNNVWDYSIVVFSLLNEYIFLFCIVEDDLQNNQTSYGCCDYALIGLSYVIGILFLPIFLFMSIKIVKEYERAVIMRLGKLNWREQKYNLTMCILIFNGQGFFFIFLWYLTFLEFFVKYDFKINQAENYTIILIECILQNNLKKKKMFW